MSTEHMNNPQAVFIVLRAQEFFTVLKSRVERKSQTLA